MSFRIFTNGLTFICIFSAFTKHKKHTHTHTQNELQVSFRSMTFYVAMSHFYARSLLASLFPVFIVTQIKFKSSFHKWSCLLVCLTPTRLQPQGQLNHLFLKGHIKLCSNLSPQKRIKRPRNTWLFSSAILTSDYTIGDYNLRLQVQFQSYIVHDGYDVVGLRLWCPNIASTWPLQMITAFACL